MIASARRPAGRSWAPLVACIHGGQLLQCTGATSRHVPCPQSSAKRVRALPGQAAQSPPVRLVNNLGPRASSWSGKPRSGQYQIDIVADSLEISCLRWGSPIWQAVPVVECLALLITEGGSPSQLGKTCIPQGAHRMGGSVWASIPKRQSAIERPTVTASRGPLVIQTELRSIMSMCRRTICVLLAIVFTVGTLVPSAHAAPHWPKWVREVARAIGGLGCSAGAVTIACTPGLNPLIASPIGTALVGAEVKLLGSSAGTKDRSSKSSSPVPDILPFYAGPPVPEFCGDSGDSCVALEALLRADYGPLALSGASVATDNLIKAVNSVDVNRFLSDIGNYESEAVIRADMLAMAAQWDSVAYWYNISEAELSSGSPGWVLQITPLVLGAARDSIAANGLPAEEVAAFLNAGLTETEIDSITSFTIDALGSINLIVQPLTMSQVLQETADAYRLLAQVSWTSVDDQGPAQDRISIQQNAPNPFNPTTVISFTLPDPGKARLAIYDLRGAHVATLFDADLPAGEQRAEWNGRDEHGAIVPSGVYFARLESAAGVRTVKVTLAK